MKTTLVIIILCLFLYAPIELTRKIMEWTNNFDHSYWAAYTLWSPMFEVGVIWSLYFLGAILVARRVR